MQRCNFEVYVHSHGPTKCKKEQVLISKKKRGSGGGVREREREREREKEYVHKFILVAHVMSDTPIHFFTPRKET